MADRDIGVDAEIERIRMQILGSNPSDTPAAGYIFVFQKADGTYIKLPSAAVIGPFGVGGGVSDGDKGDITVSASGAVWTIDNGVVTFAKMQAITDGKLLGASGGTAVEEITISTGLQLASNNLSSTITQYTDELAQDAIGNNVGAGLSYNDGTGAISSTITQYTDELAQDAVGNAVGAGLSYDDGTGAISATGGGLVLNVNTTPVGNVTTGEDTLITYTVPANTLDTNGQFIQFEMAGTFASSLNSKRVRVYFGAALLLDTGALAITAAGDWSVFGYIVRTGAATQRCVATLTTNEAALLASADYVDATEDLTGTVILKATGEATATDDIIQKFQLVVKGGGAGGSGGGGGGGWQNRATLWVDEFTNVTGTWLVNYDSGARYGWFVAHAVENDGDAYSLTFSLAAGNYIMHTLGVVFTSYGKADYAVDGSNILTGQDWYSAGAGYNTEKTGSVTILTSGNHVLRVTVNGKNVSSSSYRLSLTKIWFEPA